MKYGQRELQWLHWRAGQCSCQECIGYSWNSFSAGGSGSTHMFSLSQLTPRTPCEVQVIAGALAVADGAVCVLSERDPRISITSGWPFNYETAWQKGTWTCPLEILCMLVSKLLNRCGRCVLAWVAAERSPSHWKTHRAPILPSFTQLALVPLLILITLKFRICEYSVCYRAWGLWDLGTHFLW